MGPTANRPLTLQAEPSLPAPTRKSRNTARNPVLTVSQLGHCSSVVSTVRTTTRCKESRIPLKIPILPTALPLFSGSLLLSDDLLPSNRPPNPVGCGLLATRVSLSDPLRPRFCPGASSPGRTFHRRQANEMFAWANSKLAELSETLAPPPDGPSSRFLSSLASRDKPSALACLSDPTFDVYAPLKPRGVCAVHVAASYGSLNVLREILNRGVRADFCDHAGMGALHHASSSSSMTPR